MITTCPALMYVIIFRAPSDALCTVCHFLQLFFISARLPILRKHGSHYTAPAYTKRWCPPTTTNPSDIAVYKKEPGAALAAVSVFFIWDLLHKLRTYPKILGVSIKYVPKAGIGVGVECNIFWLLICDRRSRTESISYLVIVYTVLPSKRRFQALTLDVFNRGLPVAPSLYMWRVELETKNDFWNGGKVSIVMDGN